MTSSNSILAIRYVLTRGTLRNNRTYLPDTINIIRSNFRRAIIGNCSQMNRHSHFLRLLRHTCTANHFLNRSGRVHHRLKTFRQNRANRTNAVISSSIQLCLIRRTRNYLIHLFHNPNSTKFSHSSFPTRLFHRSKVHEVQTTVCTSGYTNNLGLTRRGHNF